MAAVIPETRRSSNGAVGYLSWKSYLDGGLGGVSEAVVLEGGHRVGLSWVDGHSSQFSLKWLRDHSDGSFHVNTMQRKVDASSIPNDTRVDYASIKTVLPSSPSNADPATSKGERPQQVLRLRWDADGHELGDHEEECTVSIKHLRQHCSSETARNLRRQLGASINAEIPDPTPVLWGKGVLSTAAGKSSVRFEYKEIMEDEQTSSPASASSSSASSSSSSPSSSSSSSSSSPSSKSQTASCQLRGALKSHGIALVRGVPTDAAATEALGLKLAGHLMSTSMGKTVWGISTENVKPDSLFRDSAYTTGALPLHTDHSFVSETPGLQIFSCLVPASEGGASTYMDGFAVAERLRKEDPEAFDFFTRTSIEYQYVDDEYHLVADGPIFQTDSLGAVVQVRYHEQYRAPLNYLSTDDIDRFYEHHQSLIVIMRDPSMVEHILLEPGDTMVFNNHRALHGRESYKGGRRMAGCYIGKDEANSQARKKGFKA